MLCLLDDERGELPGPADEPGDLVAGGAIGDGSRAFGGQAEFPADGLVHFQHVASQ